MSRPVEGSAHTFGSEGITSRRFECGWGPRAEPALEVARRLQLLNRRLAEVEPAHREIWPLFAARAIRPGYDPGPVLDMTLEALSSLIDRKARFDPPRLPAPVGDTGYNIVLSANRIMLDPLTIGVHLHAGAYNCGYKWNEANVDYHAEHAIWSEVELGLKVLAALVESLEPDWVCAAGFVDDDNSEQEPLGRSWLAWTAPGKEIPEFWLRANNAPAEVREAYGGELRVWP